MVTSHVLRSSSFRVSSELDITSVIQFSLQSLIGGKIDPRDEVIMMMVVVVAVAFLNTMQIVRSICAAAVH